MTKEQLAICEALDNFANELEDKFLELCNYNDYNKLTLLKIGETIDSICNKHIEKAVGEHT